MSRPCREWACPNLVNSRSQQGYCDGHADKRSNWNKRKDRKGSTTERGYGHAWVKLRKRVLERDSYLCLACKSKDRITEAKDIDHILAKAHGGTDCLDNLQALCAPCHKAKTAKEGQ